MRLDRKILHALPLPALALVVLAGCAAKQDVGASPKAAPPPSEGATSTQAQDDANRKLTAAECDELASWIVQVCHTDTTRSSQIEGWCSDVVAKSGEGAWQADDCGKHIHYVDFACFRSTDSARSLMACV